MSAVAAFPAYAGTLYADTNSTLYTVNEATGALTTIASGFSQARGIAVDGSGNVYVADYGASTVSKISGGTVANFVSGITGAYGLLFDPSGNLLVSTDTGHIYTYDTGASLQSDVSVGTNLTDMIYNPSNGHLLVSGRTTGNVIDVTNGNTVFANLGTTGSFTNAARGLTAVGGVIYADDSTGVNGTTGTIFKLDQTDGSPLGTLFTDSANGAKGSAYDPDTGLIYYAGAGGVGAAGGGLYSFDPTNPGQAPTLLSATNPVSAFQSVAVATPEPAALTVLGAALIALVGARRSRKERAAS